jgi:two-component system chemotaxis response regulator CheY
MTRRKVLSVGQCATDDSKLRRALESRYAIDLVAVDTTEEALTHARQGGYALVLVNRVFDHDESSGLDLIRTLKADPALAALPVMLVSNFPDAQADAVAFGALVGFGKGSLSATATFALLDPILGTHARD